VLRKQFTLVAAPCNSLDHGLDQVVDEVLPVAVVATLDVMQPLLVHATLYGKTHQTISQSWHEYKHKASCAYHIHHLCYQATLRCDVARLMQDTAVT